MLQRARPGAVTFASPGSHSAPIGFCAYVFRACEYRKSALYLHEGTLPTDRHRKRVRCVALKQQFSQEQIVVTAGWAFAVPCDVLTATACGSPGAHLNPAVTVTVAIKTGDYTHVRIAGEHSELREPTRGVLAARRLDFGRSTSDFAVKSVTMPDRN